MGILYNLNMGKELFQKATLPVSKLCKWKLTVFGVLPYFKILQSVENCKKMDEIHKNRQFALLTRPLLYEISMCLNLSSFFSFS